MSERPAFDVRPGPALTRGATASNALKVRSHGTEGCGAQGSPRQEGPRDEKSRALWSSHRVLPSIGSEVTSDVSSSSGRAVNSIGPKYIGFLTVQASPDWPVGYRLFLVYRMLLSTGFQELLSGYPVSLLIVSFTNLISMASTVSFFFPRGRRP
jgi:hypothetical protein